jgi:uncharacterized membrane protein YebE (DUF533 family)
MSLTDHQRRWLGTAIAMASADGVLDEKERELIDQIVDVLGLSAEAKGDVEKMIADPPSPVELSSWAISTKNRVALYQSAAKMAMVDGHVDEREESLLQCLAYVLKLTEEETAAAKATVAGGPAETGA